MLAAILDSCLLSSITWRTDSEGRRTSELVIRARPFQARMLAAHAKEITTVLAGRYGAGVKVKVDLANTG